MNLKSLELLSQIRIELPKEAEMEIAKAYVDKKVLVEDMKDKTILELLEPLKEGFPSVYKLYSKIFTFGCSTAVCEKWLTDLSFF